MKTLRILPSAAGIIALTATIGFVDGQREIESFSGDKAHVIIADASVRTMGASGETLSANNFGSELPAYLVRVKRGEISRDVLIDALTGGVLKP